VSTEARTTNFSSVLAEGVLHALLKDKGRDEVAPDLTALKDQEEGTKITRYNRILRFTAQL